MTKTSSTKRAPRTKKAAAAKVSVPAVIETMQVETEVSAPAPDMSLMIAAVSDQPYDAEQAWQLDHPSIDVDGSVPDHDDITSSDDEQIGLIAELDAEDIQILDDEQPVIEPLGVENVELTATEEFLLEREIAGLEEETAAEGTLDPEPAEEVVEQHVAPFAELRHMIRAETVEEYREAIYGELIDRKDYEITTDPSNENIHKTLKKVSETLDTEWAARTIAALQVSPSFINRQVNAGARYNVYALLKLTDILSGLSGAFVQNKINLAVMKSLFRCRKAGVAFTGDLAKAAASDKIRIDNRFKEVLIRHTVSAGTAPTQSSSTMNALETLGLVKNTGTKKAPIFELTEHPAVKLLEEKLAA